MAGAMFGTHDIQFICILVITLPPPFKAERRHRLSLCAHTCPPPNKTTFSIMMRLVYNQVKKITSKVLFLRLLTIIKLVITSRYLNCNCSKPIKMWFVKGGLLKTNKKTAGHGGGSTLPITSLVSWQRELSRDQ